VRIKDGALRIAWRPSMRTATKPYPISAAADVRSLTKCAEGGNVGRALHRFAPRTTRQSASSVWHSPAAANNLSSHTAHHLMEGTHGSEDQRRFWEDLLSALNAKVEALSLRDASAWDEAIDWGVPTTARCVRRSGDRSRAPSSIDASGGCSTTEHLDVSTAVPDRRSTPTSVYAHRKARRQRRRKQALPCNSTGRSVGASSIEDDIPAFGCMYRTSEQSANRSATLFSIYGREMP